MHANDESKSKDSRDGGMVPQPAEIVEQDEQGLHALRDSSNGLDVPTKQNTNGEVVAKEDNEWTEEEKKKVELNTKAINLMHCAISFEEYRKVPRCKTAKEIWDKLRITHEGTIQVKETIIDMLMKEYEMFNMKEEESID
ncbi:uncharacterized protein LOC107615934 [Arachis ipaensis]|uniref:uncharacterized protein LOC107615934 n=1 Tax=Arachis ipaensis TaxID=130454 RepID=UPI0007AF42C1|nr:uncharacterized protein LOC107615934 [Arachis ipaensis]